MNEAIAFDTLRFAKYLAENGFTEQQAETMAEAQVKFLNANLATLATKADVANMATKADLAQVRADLKADIAQVRADTKADIAQVQVGLIKWMVGVGLAVVAVQATLLVGLLS